MIRITSEDKIILKTSNKKGKYGWSKKCLVISKLDLELSMWAKIIQFIKDWGSNPIVSGLLLMAVGGILTKILPKLWKQFISIIAWLWAQILGRGSERAFDKNYLDWLIGQHQHLGLLPASVVMGRWGERQKYVDLEDVYVKLSMSSKSEENLRVKSLKNSWRTPYRPLLTETYQTYQAGDIGLVIDLHNRLVIRGDPGSGKTTLLRYLAVTCARALRKNKSEGDSPYLVKERLLWNTRPFPILVTLRKHGKVLSWDEKKELIDTFLEEMPFELRKQCPKDFFERRLRKGNCLVLLDAFDELGSPDARVAMALRITGFLQIYNHPRNRIVVATRIIGYEGQLDRYQFEVRTVQNLKAGEIRALVKQRYRAIAISETISRQPQETRALWQNLLRRSDRLIKKIESTPRLAQLATNPLLLSLIVLIHFLKVELPEERILLYRDCVEILTERWPQVRREEAGIPREVHYEELTLAQKLVLLREIAFAMQQQRKEEVSPVLMPKDTVRDLIAEKLPDIMTVELSQPENTRHEFYNRKAEEWINGIQVESGILVEQGLDEAGEPLLGFSHLTFQEYLAAVAVSEIYENQLVLWHNLLQPSWREVVLLYVALAPDATPLIQALLESPKQPDGLLLAGYCMAERVKSLRPDVQQMTLTKLKKGFTTSLLDKVSDFGKVMGVIGGKEVVSFMRYQLNSTAQKRRLIAIEALGQMRADDLELEGIRADLLQLVETSSDLEITVAARESLAQIGDPRFIDLEPKLIHIPKPVKYTLSRAYTAMRRRLISNEFEIGKYLITNVEYNRFVEATGHMAPKFWVEQTFPSEIATHPVVGITPSDAEAYCNWLNQETGKRYRLPTEWEWQWAATGPHGWQYPWGNQFDRRKCNTEESYIYRTTPVGSYMLGASSFGVSDMSGNVNEITKGYHFSFFIPRLLICYLLYTVFGLPILLLINLFSHYESIMIFLIISLFSIITVLYTFRSKFFDGSIKAVSRGGSYRNTREAATCFHRASIDGASRDTGFRCLREI